MPLHCTMVNAGRQIGGYPIRQYKPPPGGSGSSTEGCGAAPPKPLLCFYPQRRATPACRSARNALFALFLQSVEYVGDFLSFSRT